MQQKLPPTVGHHFSDILICKQKAWLHYHGNPREKLRPPVNLRVLQVEGQRLETEVYASRYEGAFKIPGIGTKPHIRSVKTKEAMQRGEPIILQGYVETPHGNGTIDVMELVGPDSQSCVGYAYRVGEIKRSQNLMTSHIMQVSWYTELLEQAYGQTVTEGFFLLGAHNNQSHVETLEDYASDYQILKTSLFELRDTPTAPGPHLIPACASCDWRGVCMPTLVHSDHLSLLAVFTPVQVASLKSFGCTKWQDIQSISDQTFSEIGLTPFEIELVRNNFENVSNGLAALRNQFRKDLFDGAVAVSFDFQNLSPSRMDKTDLLPISVYWYQGSKLRTAKIQYDANGIGRTGIKELLANKMLAFYGGTDIGAFAKILKNQPDIEYPELFDVFNFIEQNTHIPILGLELRSLIQHIMTKETTQTGPKRAWAITQVLHWLSASL